MAKILYFENDEALRRITKDFLSVHYNVEAYSSPDDFIFNTGRIWYKKLLDYDLVLTDIDMPGTNRLQFVREFIVNTKINKPIIFLRGGNEEKRVKEAGIEEYIFLAKPVNPSELLKTIEEVLQQNK